MIHVENFHRLDCGHLVGFVDIVIPKWCLSIKGVAVFDKNGGRWVKMPQKRHQEGDGETNYADAMAWTDKAVETRFRDAVLRALEAGGHIPPKADAPKPNRKTPGRMTYRGGQYRPDDFQGVQPGDDIPY